MGINYSPRIVTDGLVLLLDAANPKCFTPGNTYGNNIITGGALTGANGTPYAGAHIASPSAFPAYNSNGGGCFYFDGSKGINCDEDLGSHLALTLTICFLKSSSGTSYFTDARNNGGQWFLSNYTEDNINYTEALTYNFGGTYNASHADFINKWYIMSVTSDSSGSALYLNGEIISGGARNSINENLGVNFRIGTRFTTSSSWVGYMGPIMIYNYKQTPEEVKQNFNSLRGRFGL